MEFHERLKQLRLEASITQETLAQAISVRRPAISGYETKQQQPDFQRLYLIANYFDVSIDYLLGYSDIKNPGNTAPPPVLSADQRELLQLYSQLSRLNQGRALERIRILTEEENRQALSKAAHESTNKISG